MVGVASEAQGRFAAWLRERPEVDAARVRVEPFSTPAAGMSNETLLTTVDWGDGERDVVVRLTPPGPGLFPRYDLDRQVGVLRALEASAVPVPAVLWWEPDAEAMGRPFFVMEKVPGRIPPDGHAFAGWVHELPAAGQSRLLDAALAAMAAIHRVDLRETGLGFLDRPEHGPTPLEQEIGYWRDYLAWAADGGAVPEVSDAIAWCEAGRPRDGGATHRQLAWGDARLGNLVVDDALGVAAVLDWEMAVVGPPELDLGWYLFLERTMLQFCQQLPGFGDRGDTVARYERHLGRAVRDLDWYEAWGGVRAACIQVRMATTPEARERNPVARVLRGLVQQ